MDDNFVFKFGKHAGKTYGWVRENAPSYLAWVKENAPNMLKVPKPKEPKPIVVPKTIDLSDNSIKAMVPNLNFWNEGPDKISLPYLKRMEG